MSEHQRIAFRAIDAPVSEENLEYMRRQSSRAEITPWSFDNEYHYGDFGGNAIEMLRRGYDIHLHYANFGVRKLLIRIPFNLADSEPTKAYFGKDSLQFKKDKDGPEGILTVEPFHESGDLDELWEFDELIERLIPLRAEIRDGDLRPVYLAHLAIASDGDHDHEKTTEGPVPAGLQKLTDAQQALAELYQLSESLIAAAAEAAPDHTAATDIQGQHLEWLRGQPEAKKDAWLAQWLGDPHSGVRREVLTEFQKAFQAPPWPTIRRNRTIAELHTREEEIAQESKRKKAEAAARQKAKRLADMAADPAPTLKKAEELVKKRSGTSYEEAAVLLAELREALTGSSKAALAQEHAAMLKKKNPTLHLLTKEFRRQGLLGK